MPPVKRQIVPVSFAREHGALTATTAIKLFAVPPGRKFRLDRAVYLNPAGLALDATNAFRGELKRGSTLVAPLFNTDADDVPAGAALVANTPIDAAIVPAAAVLTAAETLDLVFTEDGTATLPAGSIYIQGRLI